MKYFLTLFSLLLTVSGIYAQPVIELELSASGFTRPVDIVHAGDDRLFIAEQAGIIRILQADGSIAATPFLDIETAVRYVDNEEGFLGLAFHPDYANNGYFYVNYTVGTSTTRRTRISRFEVSQNSPDEADPASELILLEIAQPFWNHNAGDLAFGPDGYLYIPTGDGGSGGDPGNRAQSGLNLLGKILRIDVNNGTLYAIPTNNPFINDNNIENEIWSIGWRNPWRFSFDRLTGDMWVADVGQSAFEELSMEPANSPGGLNYGWRCYEANASYNLNPDCASSDQYVGPVFNYPQNSSNWGKSITGGFVYRGQDFPALYGHYVFADYHTNNFWTLHDSMGQWVLSTQGKLISGTNKVSTFGEDKDGELYVANLKSGEIFRIIETTTSIDPGVDLDVEVFPHPWKDILQVQFSRPLLESFTLRVWNANGQLVLSRKDAGTDQLILNREGLPTGIYVLEVMSEEGILYRQKLLTN
ncbi:MAG: PQQ-dependent sugar dehydrogenase [Bacteroidota bacterium]